MKKKIIVIISYIIVLFLIFIALFSLRPITNPIKYAAPTVTSTPTPIPFTFVSYTPPKIEEKSAKKPKEKLVVDKKSKG